MNSSFKEDSELYMNQFVVSYEIDSSTNIETCKFLCFDRSLDPPLENNNRALDFTQIRHIKSLTCLREISMKW